MKNKLRLGCKATVKGFKNENDNTKRLLEMGITPGITLYVLHTAPFGGGYIVKVRDYLVAIRASELLNIEFEK